MSNINGETGGSIAICLVVFVGLLPNSVGYRNRQWDVWRRKYFYGIAREVHCQVHATDGAINESLLTPETNHLSCIDFVFEYV